MKIANICVDAEGQSFWGEFTMDFTSTEYAPPLPSVAVSEKIGTTGWS
jgi:hypothetical protein